MPDTATDTPRRLTLCGCCLVALDFDPVGPRLALVMRLRDTDPHPHTLADFGVPL